MYTGRDPLSHQNEQDFPCIGLERRDKTWDIVRPTITLYMGPMKAAKTARAVQDAQKYALFCKVIYVNPKVDIRSSDGVVRSRSGLNMECVTVERLYELLSLPAFKEASVVVLDEAQFFPDLKDFVVEHYDSKSFIVASLDGDYKQGKFGQVWDLIPYARHIEKLLALCELCMNGNPAVCTITRTPLEGQVNVVGTTESVFIPVCECCRNWSYYL
jgi:thymidine kinase